MTYSLVNFLVFIGLLVVMVIELILIGLYELKSYKLEKRYKKMKTDFYRWRL